VSSRGAEKRGQHRKEVAVTEYHVSLALDDEQKKQLRQLALASDKSVRGLITDLVVEAIDQAAQAGQIPQRKRKTKKEGN